MQWHDLTLAYGQQATIICESGDGANKDWRLEFVYPPLKWEAGTEYKSDISLLIQGDRNPVKSILNCLPSRAASNSTQK